MRIYPYNSEIKSFAFLTSCISYKGRERKKEKDRENMNFMK